MPGFAALIAKEGPTDFSGFSMPALSPLTISKKTAPGYTVCHYVTQKFERDKICQEDDELLVALEGVLLNSRALQARHAASDLFQTVKRMYAAAGDEFFRDFRGEFSGLLYDKLARKWLAFTNHLGLKPVFFYACDEGLVCGTDLPVIAELLRRRAWGYSLDVEAAYFLLTYGYMLEDYTLLREVRKLRPGQYLKYEGGKLSLQQYHTFRQDAWINDSPGDSLERTEELFRQAISAEYDKDRECGYRHLAHLSGGLDSRMNVFAARELGYDGIVNMTFSQGDYLDDTVAKRIAADLGNEFLFYALDNGNFLRYTLDEAVMANGGSVLYSGAAHELRMYRSIGWDQFGIVHSGQFGDAVMGGFLRARGPATLSVDYAIDARLLLDRIAPTIKRIQSRYESAEAFKWLNRAVNGAVNGNLMANQYSEVLSPFVHLEFLEYCWGLPPARRVGEEHYLAWIETKHPRAGHYARTPSGLRPGASRSLIFWRWLIDGTRRRLWSARSKWSMHPFEYWYRTNPMLRNYVDNYLSDNLPVLADFRELQADCLKLSQEGNLVEKTQVMTLLGAMKLLFPTDR